MGVDVQHGNIEDVLALAAAVGASRKEERAIQRGEAIASQIRDIQARKELAEFNAQIDMAKMKFNASMELESQRRAAMFDLEKLETMDRMDFAREERERNRRENEYQATIRYIEERDDLSPDQKKAYGFKAYMKKQGVNVSESHLLPEQRQAQRPATVSNQIAAMKELQKDIYKEPGFLKRIRPGWLGGQKELDPAIQQHKDFLEGVMAQGQIQMDDVTDPINVEPETLESFERTFIELAKIDRKKADAYFKKYTSKFD
jgi:hypothetical protein